jgi:hypothetical protein
MFCSTLKSQTSCCEIFSAIRKIPVAEENKENQQKQQFEKHSKSSSVEISSSSTSNANSESMAARTNEAPIMVQAGEQSAAGNSETPSTATECPASSMTVLSETGEMIKCDEGNRCPGVCLSFLE